MLSIFDEKIRAARKAYLSYMEKGLDHGRREELVGGGLIRSLCGWSELKRLSSRDRCHVMSDERIVGESEFVESILSEAGQACERRYELKALGYDLGRVEQRDADLYEMEFQELFF